MLCISNYKRKFKKGVAMVEYAILLAFIVVVASTFLDDNGISNGINSAVAKVIKIFNNDADATVKNLLANAEITKGVWNSGLVNNDKTTSIRAHSDIVSIEPGETYVMTLDLNKVILNNGDSLQYGFFTTDSSGTRTGAGFIDSGWINPTTNRIDTMNQYTRSYNPETNISTLTFTAKEGATQFAMNFQSNGTKSITTTENVDKMLKDAITLTKVEK